LLRKETSLSNLLLW